MMNTSLCEECRNTSIWVLTVQVDIDLTITIQMCDAHKEEALTTRPTKQWMVLDVRPVIERRGSERILEVTDPRRSQA